MSLALVPSPRTLVREESIRLYRRASESVRILRAPTPEGGLRLLIFGPGNTHQAYDFPDSPSCVSRQLELERRLEGQGYWLERTA